jgi:hypothetical protein
VRFERIVGDIAQELTPEDVRGVLEPLVHAAFFSITPPERYVAGWSMTIRTPRPAYDSDIAVYHETHSVYLSCWQKGRRRPRRDLELLDTLAEALAEAFGGTVVAREDGREVPRSA